MEFFYEAIFQLVTVRQLEKSFMNLPIILKNIF